MLTIIGVVILLGILVWGVNYLPFIAPDFKKVIIVIIVVATAFYLLNAFGIFPGIPTRLK